MSSSHSNNWNNHILCFWWCFLHLRLWLIPKCSWWCFLHWRLWLIPKWFGWCSLHLRLWLIPKYFQVWVWTWVRKQQGTQWWSPTHKLRRMDQPFHTNEPDAISVDRNQMYPWRRGWQCRYQHSRIHNGQSSLPTNPIQILQSLGMLVLERRGK